MAFLRQAKASEDPIATLVLISTALEFCAAGAEKKDLFGKGELRAARKRASEGLSEEQCERLVQIMPLANEPSFNVRLSVALANDGVPIADAERELLDSLRKMRNVLAHGKEFPEPAAQDLRTAIAVVSLMLVYRAWNSA